MDNFHTMNVLEKREFVKNKVSYNYHFCENNVLMSWNIHHMYYPCMTREMLKVIKRTGLFLGVFNKAKTGMMFGYIKTVMPHWEKYIRVYANSTSNTPYYLYYVSKEDYLINHTEEEYNKAKIKADKWIDNVLNKYNNTISNFLTDQKSRLVQFQKS